MPPLQNVCVVTTFYTLVGILSILFSGVALDIITCRPLAVDEELKMIPYNKSLVSNARTLRKNMTPEEKHLWYDFLKRLPYNVRRQHNIENYIVDFYIAEKKIVIEVDGVQHLSSEHKEADEQRDAVLSSWGIVVLRYSNGIV